MTSDRGPFGTAGRPSAMSTTVVDALRADPRRLLAWPSLVGNEVEARQLRIENSIEFLDTVLREVVAIEEVFDVVQLQQTIEFEIWDLELLRRSRELAPDLVSVQNRSP